MSAPVEVTDPASTPAEPVTPVATDETPEERVARLEKDLADTRREAAKYRTTARDNATAAKELETIRESQKTEAQKIQDRADAAEKRANDAETELIRERIARRHHLDEDDLDLLGTGTEEQIEARAKKIAAKNAAAAGVTATAPPSGKPVESLRPGATSSDKDISPPDAYPSSWRTAKTTQPRPKGLGNG